MPNEGQQHDSESWVDRVEWAIALALQIGIAGVTAGALLQEQWLVAYSGSVVLLLTFAPALIERRLRVTLPVEFTLITSVFLYASFALGEVGDFYEKYWWWDLALHGISALIFGFIGFLGIYVFYMTKRVQVAPAWIATITFALAVSIGTLWEIFEFTMDWFFDLSMQKSGLVDTMTDLMIDATGAAIAAIAGYFYVRDKDNLLVHRLIRACDELRRRHKKIDGSDAT
jgi:hypothetical protein